MTVNQCEGCRGSGTNWSCDGENEGQYCTCESCTGDPGCQECEAGDEVRREAREAEEN